MGKTKVKQEPEIDNQQLTLSRCLANAANSTRLTSTGDAGAPPTASSSGTIRQRSHDSPERDAMNNLSKDKHKYNKFHYRLASNSNLRAVWDTMTDPKERSDFIEAVVITKPKQMAMVVEKCRRLTVKTAESTEGEWVSFNFLANRDGRDLVLEYIETGAVKTRPNPKLRGGSRIKWPENLELAFVSEKWSSGRQHEDTTDIKPEGNIDELEVAKTTSDFDHFLETSGNKCGSGTSSASSAHDSSADQHSASKACVANVRKTHAQVDKCVREWKGVIARSKEGEATRGTKFEVDLATFAADALQMDEQLLSAERECLSKGKLDDDSILQAATTTNELATLLKNGAKRASALKPWFNM